jgi:hypothetical protein
MYGPVLSFPGRSQELGVSSQSHGAVSGRGTIVTECQKFHYLLQCDWLFNILRWKCLLPVFWIAHKVSWSTYFLFNWYFCGRKEGLSVIFFHLGDITPLSFLYFVVGLAAYMLLCADFLGMWSQTKHALWFLSIFRNS